MKLLVEYFKNLWKFIKFLIKRLFRKRTKEIESPSEDSSKPIGTKRYQIDPIKELSVPEENYVGSIRSAIGVNTDDLRSIQNSLRNRSVVNSYLSTFYL